MTREELEKAAADLVATWAPPSPEQIAKIAALIRPAVIKLTEAHTASTTTRRPRIPKQRAA